MLVVLTGAMLTGIIFLTAKGSEWGVLTVGVSFTSLFAAYLVLLIGRKAEIERTVESRTAQLQKEITERKRMEEAVHDLNRQLEQRVAERTAELQAANEQLEAFMYSISHDLRAPLRHMNGFSRILQKEYAEALPDGARSYLNRVSESASHMGILVDELLNLSRIGRNALNLRPVELNTLVEGAMAELELETAGRDIAWKIGRLPRVQGDPVLLQQVIVNLLSNAVKFTRNEAHPTVEIAPLPDGSPGFLVKDNGVGFDGQYAERLFGAFQRLHRKDEFEGVGIGLATVQRIIASHNGRVWAEAEVEKGATFYVALPAPSLNNKEA